MTLEPAISLGNHKVYHGNCLDVLKEFPDNSIDSIVTDPPYELGFMGKKWDNSGIAFNVEVWKECLRVLKPGGHLLAFGGTRTWHRLAVAIEDAGFEIRDSIAWLYGSGFPKSMNVAASIEAKLTTGSANKTMFKNLQGEHVERTDGNSFNKANAEHGIRPADYSQTAGDTRLAKVKPTTTEAEQWQGWGTALKPAFEPVVVARKPIIGTVAENVITYGTGALNIDASRIGFQSDSDKASATPQGKVTSNLSAGAAPDVNDAGRQEVERPDNSGGRFPANVMLCHTEECIEVSAGTLESTPAEEVSGGIWSESTGKPAGPTYNDTPAVWQCVEGCPVYILDQQSGTSKSKAAAMAVPDIRSGKYGSEYGTREDLEKTVRGFNDAGGASRFFYVAKASKKDRNEGLDDFESKSLGIKGHGLGRICSICGAKQMNPCGCEGATFVNPERKNFHPTVKPTQLMRYLVTLITPQGGTVLDPFTGSGSTGKAAILEKFNFIGIELTEDYLPIIEGRLIHAKEQVDSTLY